MKKHGYDNFKNVGYFLISKDEKSDDLLHIQNFEGSFGLASYKILDFLHPKVYNWIMGNDFPYNDNAHKRFLDLINVVSKPSYY